MMQMEFFMETGQLPPPPITPARTNVPALDDARTNGHPPVADNGAADHDQIDLNVAPARTGWIIAAVVVIGVLIAVLFAVGFLPRLGVNKELARDADAALHAAVPVTVVKPRRADAIMQVRLPGTLRPWQEVSIFARTTGYLAHFDVDISNQVKKGQLMAKIDSPEVDAQLRGAQAMLLQQQAAAAKAQTDLGLAQTTWKRFESLRGTSGVTQQELDQYQSNYNAAVSTLGVATANIAVAQADVRRLTDMQKFETITAPFSGVVTGRAFDVGAMILANPTSVDTQPMFKIAENDTLRAFIYVPQNYSLTIKQGMKVNITSRERPGRVFVGEVLGTTNYLDPAARSLMTEVKIVNPDLALLPGMYVEANFQVKRDHPPLLIPGPAVVINADGDQVGVVQDNKIHYKKVKLGVDYGNNIEIISGLDINDQVIENPGGKTVEGAAAKIAGEEKVPAPVGEQAQTNATQKSK
ncbi:MAG TPA: efflux RND transporter periplasmic adaptor subunit [Tepidisphaeraceae bacterium]|nr:efflux RND transporter periplasmic adaptor subunit [Tepidisphaeraceae bacterium]